MRSACLASVVLLAAGAAPVQGPSDPASAWARSVSTQIDAHEFEAALETAALALEHWPDDAELLDLASLAALENADNDVALWYGELALERRRAALDPAAKAPPPEVLALERRVAELDPLGRRAQSLIAEYRDALFAAGKSVAKRKLVVNAVELFTRSRDLGLAEPSEAELAKVYGNPRSVEALLDSGLDVPLRSKKKRRSPEQIAREDGKHADWEHAYEIKGDNYTIKTTLGIELAETMSLAMEQMNRFYRSVFHVKERGGNTARVVVSVYKDRAEFEQNEGDKAKEVLGFFQPIANRVCAYDTRSDGYAASELWSTLFHEASHQFTHLISADLIPAWLNEGTASYFEGARLLANGSVETNLVPEGRLIDLKASLDEGSPTLKEVVSYFEPGSYPGEYYAFGWGLVYFLLNFEDEKCERVYAPIYRAYTEAYGSGGKHDAFERFVEYFVTKAKQPGIATLEEFEARWKQWIEELHGLHFGPATAADALIARARKQRAAKKLDAAIESYRFALRKRPGDAVALAELGDALAAVKNEDGALYHYRRALVAARTASDASKPLGASSLSAGEILERCASAVAKLDAELGKAVNAADLKLLAGATESAAAYVEKELPRAALRLLDAARDACGGSAELARLRERIAAETECDTLRWRRPRIVEGLADWHAAERFAGKDGVLSCRADRPSFATWREELPERYRLELSLAVEKLEGAGFLALVFGAGDNALQYVGVDSDGLVEVGKLLREWTPIERLALVPKELLSDFRLALDVSPERVRFFLDDIQVHERAYAPDELRGRIGVYLQDGAASFRDLRVRY
jgi:hypothetical protein